MNIPMVYHASSPGIVKQGCATPKYICNEEETGLKCTQPEASLYKTCAVIRTLVL